MAVRTDYLYRAITKAYDRKNEMRQPYVYWLVDVHDTILVSFKNELRYINPTVAPALRKITSHKSTKLIIWTSSYPEYTAKIKTMLERDGIRVDYINENPEILNTAHGFFNGVGSKIYSSIIIDDKAGFDPWHWSYAANYVPLNE